MAADAAHEAQNAGRLGWLARSSLAPPIAIALACAFIGVNEVGYRTISAITVDRDKAVRARMVVEQLRAALVAAESAQRGLMLTQRPSYREGFALSLADVAASMGEARSVAVSRPQEAPAVDAVVELVKRRVSELEETIKQLDNGNSEGALELLLSDIGREQMAEIDRSVAALALAQNAELQRSAALRDQVLMYSRISILALVLSCLAAMLTTMRVLRHRDAERQGHLNTLSAERDKLEDTVTSRTSELSDLTRHLQTVREDERSHLARELHDELGGLLTAAKLDLARMRSRLVQAGPEVAERVAHLHATLDAGIALKRRIIEDLRPSSLDNLGLGQALRILCQEWSTASGVPVQVKLEEQNLGSERSLVIYRLVQEALTNIAKHARAGQVSVTLTTENGLAAVRPHIIVEVRDNGRGFESAQRSQGHGLAGMRFRVSSIGGQLTVESAPDKGTCIRARLPKDD